MTKYQLRSIGSLITIFGLPYLISRFSESKPENPLVERNLKVGLPSSRDSEDPKELRDRNDISFPNSRSKMELTKSRSKRTSDSSKLRTSKLNSMETRSENGTDIRKYPSYYYTLSSKSKWEFRQKLKSQAV